MNNVYWAVFIFLALILIECAVFLRKITSNRPEYLFLIIVLTTSVFFSWSLSPWQYSWDDGVHYNLISTMGMDGSEIELSAAEVQVTTFVDPVTEGNVNNVADHSLDATLVRSFMLDELHQEEGNSQASRPFSLTEIEYLPCVFVRYVCSVLDLPFSLTFFLSKLPCALFYSFITFFGMRRLRSGKMLYAVAALLPTNIFLAANYSYSYWTFSLILYGLASFVGMIQSGDQPKVSGVVLMLGAFFLGCLPRIVYFPLMLICLTLPRSQFANTRNAVFYRCAVLLACVLTAAVFFLPVTSSGLGTGDHRGGATISPSAQLQFILDNPLDYVKIFLNFLLPPFAMEGGIPDTEGPHYVVSGFLSLEGLPGWLVNYGYLPRASFIYSGVLVLLLVFTALTDGRAQDEVVDSLGDHETKRRDQVGDSSKIDLLQNRNELSGESAIRLHSKVIPEIIAWIACIASMVLIITYMYLVFTNVGHNEIRGVQRRYMLPFIYPMLAFVSFKRLTLPGKRVPAWIYNTAILLIMAFVLMASWWQVYLVGLN